MKRFLYFNAAGLSAVAFASYFDVYSHAHIFVEVDPWWNPAHLILYAGFAVLAYGTATSRPPGNIGKLSTAGTVVVLAAAVFNEVWHRVLLFGNPIPEPFPVEPPHALLAIGFVLLGVSAILQPLKDGSAALGRKERLVVSFLSGSLWLIVAGSAFYIAGAYVSTSAYLFAVGVGSFSGSLFLVYPAALSGRFGYATVSYLWFLLVYYIFFVGIAGGFPLGVVLVLMIDFGLSRRKLAGVGSRLVVLPVFGLLYGVIYYPILPPSLTLALNAGTVASFAGATLEFAAERAYAVRTSAERISLEAEPSPTAS